MSVSENAGVNWIQDYTNLRKANVSSVLSVVSVQYNTKIYTRENKRKNYLALLSNVKFHLYILAKHLSPREFILHLHPANRETQTCHWGFDVSNWRSYLHIQVFLNMNFFISIHHKTCNIGHISIIQIAFCSTKYTSRKTLIRITVIYLVRMETIRSRMSNI